MAYMKQALKEGYTQPKVVLAGFEDSISSYLVDKVEASGFYEPFTRFPEYFSEEEKTNLTNQGQRAIKERVLPAYQAFYDFMVEDYIPNARDDIAANTWPDGVAYYANRAKHYTTTDMSPQDIHNLGLAEVKRTCF
jgi:uncharacterized protein (DUF885 family)